MDCAAGAVFAERTATLKAEENRLAEKAYSSLYSEETVWKMDRLPDEFFHQKSVIYIQCGKDEDKLVFNMSSSKRIPACDNQFRKPCVVLTSDEDKCEVLKYISLSSQLDTDESLFRNELRSFLAGICTIKQLVEIWPEGKGYCSDFIVPPVKKNLPSIHVLKIKQMFDEMKSGVKEVQGE